eukprot:gene14659-9778_t
MGAAAQDCLPGKEDEVSCEECGEAYCFYHGGAHR